LAGVTLRTKAHGEHLLRLVDGRRGDERAARGLQPDQLVLRQLEQRLAHQRARHTEVVGQLLLCQFAARLKPVFDDGLGECVDDRAGGGRVHAFHDRPKAQNCIHFCRPEFPECIQGARPWA